MNIFNSGILTTLFYCFGVIMPTICLLFSYGNFAYRIGEYNLEAKKLDTSLPIVIVLLLTKLFLISFVQFFIYHYIFDMTSIYQDILITVKCLLWGLLIMVDCFLLNKELLIVCKHVKSISVFRKHLYVESIKLFNKYKPLFLIKILLMLMLIVCFVISLFTNNLSSLSLILMLYLYYNIRTNNYVNKLKHDYGTQNTVQNNDGKNNTTDTK